MLKILLKSRLLSLWASLSKNGSKKKKGIGGAALGVVFAILGVYMVGVFSFLFYGMSITLKGSGEEWAVITLATIVSSSFCLIGSIFTTKTQIFESRDNDLLLSMPIKPKYILASRILVLLVINFGLESIVMLPCLVTYGIVCGYSLVGFIFAVLAYLLIPFLVLAVSAILAWIISYISSKLKNKNLVTTVLYLIFFGAYMYFCFGISNDEMININVDAFRNTFIFYYVGNSIANDNALHFLYFALSAIIPAVITFILISRSFIKIITTKKATAKIEYKEASQKTSTPFVALVKKELRRFFTTSMYMLNSGMGVIMLLIVSVLASTKAPDILNAIETQFTNPTQAVPIDLVKGLIPVLIAVAATFILSTCMVSTPSISLESKSLWILNSLPVNPSEILFAKITTHIIICAPVSIISVIIPCIAFKVSVLNAVLVIIAVISMCCFTAYFGMFLGLKYPKFDWINETVAVKQGLAVFGSMFGSMLYALVLSFIGFIVGAINPSLGIVAIIIPSVVLCTLLHLYFKNKASKDFEKLKEKQ